MKKWNLFRNRYLWILVVLFSLVWTDAGAEERKVLNQKEYKLTVASRKVPGWVTLCGSGEVLDGLAVKKSKSRQWEYLHEITGLDYVPGYEYKILIRETTYLDYSRGEPCWTEYVLIKIFSKRKKVSKNVPDNFVPDRFLQDVPGCLP